MSAHQDLRNRERAVRVAKTFLMGNAVASGFAQRVEEPSTIGWAVTEDGRLALSEVVGKHETGVTIEPNMLAEIGLALMAAHTARQERERLDAEARDYDDDGPCL